MQKMKTTVTISHQTRWWKRALRTCICSCGFRKRERCTGHGVTRCKQILNSCLLLCSFLSLSSFLLPQVNRRLFFTRYVKREPTKQKNRVIGIWVGLDPMTLRLSLLDWRATRCATAGHTLCGFNLQLYIQATRHRLSPGTHDFVAAMASGADLSPNGCAWHGSRIPRCCAAKGVPGWQGGKQKFFWTNFVSFYLFFLNYKKKFCRDFFQKKYFVWFFFFSFLQEFETQRDDARFYADFVYDTSDTTRGFEEFVSTDSAYLVDLWMSELKNKVTFYCYLLRKKRTRFLFFSLSHGLSL